MPNKIFSIIPLQTLTDVLKILTEGSTTDAFGHITGQEILDYIIAKGYLTETEINALTTLVKKADFVVDNSVIRKSGAALVNTPVNELHTAHPLFSNDGFDFTATTNLVIGGGKVSGGIMTVPAFTKTFTVFAEGTGNGCLDGASLSANKLYEIHLIVNTLAPENQYDYYVTTPGTGAPVNWTYIMSIGTFITSTYSEVHTESIIQHKEFQLYGKYGVPLPTDYISGKILYRNNNSIGTENIFTGISKAVTLKWFNNTSVVFTGLLADTIYYVFLQSYNHVYSITVDTDYEGTSLTDDFHALIATFKTDSSNYIIKSSILNKVDAIDEIIALNYYIDFDSISTNIYLDGYSATLATSLTGSTSTDYSCNGMQLGILVNSISDSGTIVVTGTSINEHNGTFNVGDTETISISIKAGQRYRTIRRWVEITNVSVADITTINYDLYVQGVQQLQGQWFELLGYSLDVVSSAIGADLRFKILKSNQLVNLIEKLETVEDIGIVSGSSGNQIVDNVSGGTRTLNPAISQILDSGEMFHLEMRNFKDLPETIYGQIYNIDGHTGSGFQILLTGQVASVPTNIKYAKLILFVKIKSLLLRD